MAVLLDFVGLSGIHGGSLTGFHGGWVFLNQWWCGYVGGNLCGGFWLIWVFGSGCSWLASYCWVVVGGCLLLGAYIIYCNICCLL